MFSDLDDLAISRILSYCKPLQLLRLSVLSSTVKNISRSNELWEPHLEIKKKQYHLAIPRIIHGSPLPAARLSLRCLCKMISVKALKELSFLLKISPREIAACSEKSEIGRLVYDRQHKLLREMQIHSIRSSYDKEWEDPVFASFWCLLHDVSRTYLLEHELIDRDWGMYWRPRNENGSPQFHTAVRFHPDGSFSGEDAQLTAMNEGKSWTRTARGIQVGPYPVLEPARTPTGGWRISNPHVIMLSDVNFANGYSAHYPG